MPVNTQVTRSIRVRNEGLTSVNSNHSNPVLLSYHWIDDRGNSIIHEGIRSPLPDRLNAGNEISVIMHIQTPPHPGSYILQIRVIQEFVQWHEDAGLDLKITITDRIDHCLSNIDRNNEPFVYERTQEEAIALVKRHFPIGPDGRRRRILEIGGGVYPVAISRSQDTAEVVSVDISFAMSQLGSIVHSLPGRGGDPLNYLFVAADAMRLPFSPGTFDGVVICRALHHFPDPIGLLRNTAKLVRSDGRFVVACEPCNPNPFHHQYLKDLRTGINEQQWALEEYAHIFAQSGLEPIEAAVICNCGLMAALKADIQH
jgi:ubiquinone/menaquinone biosynthesis C-methylase UbiE